MCVLWFSWNFGRKFSQGYGRRTTMNTESKQEFVCVCEHLNIYAFSYGFLSVRFSFFSSHSPYTNSTNPFKSLVNHIHNTKPITRSSSFWHDLCKQPAFWALFNAKRERKKSSFSRFSHIILLFYIYICDVLNPFYKLFLFNVLPYVTSALPYCCWDSGRFWFIVVLALVFFQK